MLGYCATGRFGKAIAPTRVIRIATTAANTGRSMKKCESGITARRPAWRWRPERGSPPRPG